MSGEREDILLQVNHVRYKKNNGQLYLSQTRVGWMMEESDTFTVSMLIQHWVKRRCVRKTGPQAGGSDMRPISTPRPHISTWTPITALLCAASERRRARRDSDLHVTCFSQDPDFALEKNLVKWDYSKNMGHKKADIQKRRAVFTFDDGTQLPRPHMQGSARELTQRRRARPHVPGPAATFRASKGEALRIPLSKTSGMPSRVFLKKFPPSWPTDAPNWTLPLTFASAQPYHKAIYNAGSSQDGKIDHVHTQGAYFEIMGTGVCDRRAQRLFGHGSKYGPDCSSDCPVCHNGGVCDSHTGTCVCPPGYYGTSCQHACLPGWFGASCQLPCRRDLIGFQVPEEGKCSGLTFCVPAPYGCSCAPGYKGPACDEECDAGTYGVNCQGRCDGCAAGCHPVTGTCSSCTPGSSCTALALRGTSGDSLVPLWLKALSKRKFGCAKYRAEVDYLHAVVGRDSLNVTWRGSGDRGSVYFVSHQVRVLVWRLCSWGRLLLPSLLFGFLAPVSPHLNPRDPLFCAESELRDPQQARGREARGPDGSRSGTDGPATFHSLQPPGVSSFTCTGYVDSATCYVTLAGTCAKISETDFTINVTVEAYLACNQSLVVHSAVVPNSSGARKEVTLKNVLPDQLYNASVVVTTSANQIVAEDRATFTTRPGRAASTLDVISAVAQFQRPSAWHLRPEAK
ncbi:putative angiopoietin-1 receptor, partial [Penaeus vannamei]